MKISPLLAAGILCSVLTNSSYALTNITNFTQLVQAVESGNDVRAIIFLDSCTITNPRLRTQLRTQLEGSSTRINFNQFLHIRETIDGSLVDTVTTTRKSILENSSGNIVSVYNRLSVFEDNSALLHLVILDPTTLKQQAVVDWYCTINDNTTTVNLNPTFNTTVNTTGLNNSPAQNAGKNNNSQVSNGLHLYSLENMM